MKTFRVFSFAAVAIVASTLLMACISVEIDRKGVRVGNSQAIRASRHIITRTMENPAAFSKIVVSGVGDVEYVQSTDGTTSVSIIAPDNVMEILEVHSSGGTLTVSTKRGFHIVGLGGNDMEVRATSPSLDAVRISGAGDVSIDKVLSTKDLTVTVSGVGDIEIDDLQCENVEIRVSGAGDVDVERGTAVEASYTVSGVGDIDVDGLRAQRVEARVSGTGDVECYASESINARVSGVGSIVYYGNPGSVEKSRSGIGSIQAR